MTKNSAFSLSMQDRFEVNAIIERIVEPSEFFSASDALRLIEIFPTTPRRLGFQARYESEGPGVQGHAAGVGDVQIDGDKKAKEINLNDPVTHRVGGYKIAHHPGRLLIKLMWADTRPDRSGQYCAIRYNPRDRSNLRMLISVEKELNLGFLTLGYATMVPWKSVQA